MKFKFLLSLVLGAALSMSAQGYKDGIEYYKADQFENAKTILTRTLNDASTNQSEAYFYLGEIALRNGDKAEAESCFDKGITADAANPFNYVGKAEVALSKGDKKTADEYFGKARSLGKKNAELLTAIARAYYNTDAVKYAQDVVKTIERAKKADKKDPYNLILQGDIKADEKKPGDAAALYENAILYDPNNVPAYVKYANVYFQVSPEFAIKKLEELLEIQPESALAQRELAEKYYQNDQWAKAAVAYGKYIENPNHFTEDKVRYSVLLYYGQLYDESLNLANELLVNDPKNFQLHRIAFLNKAAKKDFAGAEKQAAVFFTIATPDKYSSNDYASMGDVLKELGKDSLAVFEYQKAVNVNPDNMDLVRQLSSAYNSAKNYEKAAEVYQQIIDGGNYKTNDLFVLAGRYMSHASTEQDSVKREAALANAVKYIDDVLAKVPNDYRISQRKARILMVKNGNKPSAESSEVYKSVLAILDQDPANKTKRANDYIEAYNQIAGAYILVNDKANAIVYYEKFLDVDPSNEPLKAYVQKLKDHLAKESK